MNALFLSALLAVTAGWENRPSGERETPPARVLWQADLGRTNGFELLRIGGAEGRMRFEAGELVLKKTNDRGLLIVRSAPFACGTGARLRLAADVQVETGDVESAHLCLRAEDKAGNYPPCHALYPRRGADGLYSGGAEQMLSAVNSAPGTYYRKYAHFIGDHDETRLAILASGSPSVSRWKNWTAEDVDAAQIAWQKILSAKTAKDRAHLWVDEAAFDAALAEEGEHTAAIRREDSVVRLFVDGKAVPPAAFRAKCPFGADGLWETFSGRSVADAGVRILAKPINLGTGPKGRHYWTPAGFDAEGAVRDLKNSMRLAPDALYMIALNCNPYPEFTLKEHPDEAFRTADGNLLMGNAGSTGGAYDDMGLKDDGLRWPWVSFASRVWRDAVSENIRRLVAELKRTGLDKRIVGIHLWGFGDGQFYVGPIDCSPVAQSGYAAWCAGADHVSTNYAFYAKSLAMSAQDEFAQAFKAAMGKDVIAVSWLMAQFITTHTLGEFVRGTGVDAVVIQQSYARRAPGLWVEPRIPYSSFERHGKMYWCELDLRTYGALESWAVSAPATKGLGQADDFAAWQTIYRKHLGPVLAQRQGFWFYDMAAGWFDPPEIRDDIAETLRFQERMLTKKPSAWRPNVVVVYDEAGLIGWDGGTVPLNNYTHYLFPVALERLAMSGVPFTFYLAEDALREPSLLEDARLVVLANFRKFDDRRVAFVQKLASARRTLVFIGEPGALGGSEEALGVRVGWSLRDEPHLVRREPGVSYDLSSRIQLENERNLSEGIWPPSLAKGPRAWVETGESLKVLSRYSDGKIAAGERRMGCARLVVMAESAGLSPSFFNDLCHEAGAYVPVRGGGLQVSMNGDFVSVHALRNGAFDFVLPFACTVTNVKSGREETLCANVLPLSLTAGETCWFTLEQKKECGLTPVHRIKCIR